MARYKVEFPWGDSIELDVGTDPSSPIRVDGESTQYQFADAQCYVDNAVELVIEWLGPAYYGYDEADKAAAIEGACWDLIEDEEDTDES